MINSEHSYLKENRYDIFHYDSLNPLKKKRRCVH